MHVVSINKNLALFSREEYFVDNHAIIPEGIRTLKLSTRAKIEFLIDS